MQLPELLRETVQQVIDLLVRKEYAELESLTGGVRMGSDEIARAISRYRRTLTRPPPEAFALMDVVPIINATLPSWSIVMPLWTREEGRSDLSLQLTIIQEQNGVRIELDDIHVL